VSSFVQLTLDTTGPNVQVIVPPTTTRQALTHIVVRADEPLDTWQDEIYLIDSKGVKHILHMSHNNNEFYGEFIFGNLPSGRCTVHARVKDTVWNLSSVVQGSFVLYSNDLLFIDVTDGMNGEIVLLDKRSEVSTLKDQNFSTTTLSEQTITKVELIDKEITKINIEDKGVS
jgi:hypothetical protein